MVSRATTLAAAALASAFERALDRGDSFVTGQLDNRRPDSGSAGTDGDKPRRRLRRRLLAEPEKVEAYLRASSPPRYMQRLGQMESEFTNHCRRLGAAYEALLEAHGHDAEVFASRWHARARAWHFDRLNELIREHNAWYPVETSLPMDPRTRNFVPVRGASYRRIELGVKWVLEHFPPDPNRRAEAPELPRRVPREPLAPAARVRG
jgi:hypothetical protein